MNPESAAGPGPAPGAGRADLHLHTWHSDGLYAPAEVVRRARDAGLAAIAITDHETVAGIGEAEDAAGPGGLVIIPGVELAARYKNVEVHILGLWIDRGSAELAGLLRLLQEERQERAGQMVERLAGLGIRIGMEDVMRQAGKGGLGRPHLARALAAMGAVPDIQEAFVRYLGAGRPAYVPRKHLTPESAIEIIRRAGGVSILAHPLIGGPQREHVRELAGLGLDAIEYQHPKLSPSDSAWLADFARQHSLGLAAGSDFHGPGLSEGEVGDYWTDWEMVVELYNRRDRG